MSEASKPRPSEAFYNALPCRKAELVDGKFIVGGSAQRTKEWGALLVMTLGLRWCVGG